MWKMYTFLVLVAKYWACSTLRLESYSRLKTWIILNFNLCTCCWSSPTLQLQCSLCFLRQQWEGKQMLDFVPQIIMWHKNRCIIDTTDSSHSLNETKIWFESCAIATTVNCRCHLHGRMNRPVHMCCHWRYPWLVAYIILVEVMSQGY